MVVQNNFSSKVNLHLTRWTAAQCAVTTSDSLRFLRLQVWWMQHTIKIFSYKMCIFTFLFVEVSSTFCVWIGSREEEMSPHEQGQKVQLWQEELLVLTFFLIFTSCRTAMQHFEATMLFCVCVIAVFHHTDDPSLLHMSIFSSPWPYFDDDTSSLQNEPHLLEYPSGISDCHHKNWNKDVDISDIYRRLRSTWVTSRDGEANLSDRRRLVHLTEI